MAWDGSSFMHRRTWVNLLLVSLIIRLCLKPSRCRIIHGTSSDILWLLYLLINYHAESAEGGAVSNEIFLFEVEYAYLSENRSNWLLEIAIVVLLLGDAYFGADKTNKDKTVHAKVTISFLSRYYHGHKIFDYTFVARTHRPAHEKNIISPQSLVGARCSPNLK